MDYHAKKRTELLSKTRVRYAAPVTSKTSAALAGATGTVVDLTKTKALVDFGAKGRWRVPLQNLEPAEE